MGAKLGRLTLPSAPDAAATVITRLGLIRNEPGASPGYTLFGTNSNAVDLVNSQGQLVHQWNKHFRNAKLLENGNLMGAAGGKIWEVAPQWQRSVAVGVCGTPAASRPSALPNGNTLIVHDAPGPIFEVTPAGKKAWICQPAPARRGRPLYQGDPMPVNPRPIPGPYWENRLSRALRYPLTTWACKSWT